MDQAGFNIGASITAILPMAQVVYTGDDDGRVVRSLPQRYRSAELTSRSMNGIVFSGNNTLETGGWYEL